MKPFHFRNTTLYAEDVDLQELANAYGTPCYVYSKYAIESNYNQFADALKNWPTRICYAVKANSNIAILNILAKLGAGFDIVSIGELERVLHAGGEANKVVFSGVAKREDELRRALVAGIHCFNIESTAELERIEKIADEMGIRANVSLRVNPDVSLTTHPYISTGLKENKFGIEIGEALEVYKLIAESKHLKAIGVDCHIGSQLLDLAPLRTSFERIFELIDLLQESGIPLQHVDVGGGLGIRYAENDTPPSPTEYANIIAPFLQHRQLELIVEPGRSIVGNAGILLTQVEHLKNTSHKNFALVDAAMNDFIRPSLYSAWHGIDVVQQLDNQYNVYDVVGPVCETGDFFAKDRELAIKEGSLLAIYSAGAYGFVMSSNYNTRPRAAEVLVNGDQAYLIRKRESVEQLFANEIIPS